MQRSKGFGHGVVVSKICYLRTIQWLCPRFGLQGIDCALSCDTWLLQTNEHLSVVTELLATAGWKWGCQPFSCRCSQNVTHCRKQSCSTCLFKKSIPAIPFWKCQASTPYQKQVPESDSTLHQFCIMVASCPSLRCNFRKNPVSCRQAKGLVTDSQLWHVTAANQWTVVEIELLSTVSWQWDCQPFSFRCSQNVMHCRKEICSTWLFHESIPAFPLGNANHPLPTRSSRLLRAAVRSTSSGLCLN